MSGVRCVGRSVEKKKEYGPVGGGRVCFNGSYTIVNDPGISTTNHPPRSLVLGLFLLEYVHHAVAAGITFKVQKMISWWFETTKAYARPSHANKSKQSKFCISTPSRGHSYA
ncbi:hypothetical protein WG66_010583 [Moniliophthora roreri]|nr:hypothetical protein WG66_010583 [Moniliophthora roreri]